MTLSPRVVKPVAALPVPYPSAPCCSPRSGNRRATPACTRELMSYRQTLVPLALCVSAALPARLVAQRVESRRSLDLTVRNVGVSIGDSRRTTGLRINFRDRRMEQVNGVNVTIWTPYEANGKVNGLALGVPATGARRIDGLAVGVVGASAEERIRGIGIGGVGLGSGGGLSGVMIGGIGAGTGGDIEGIGIGGVGLGGGGDMRGLMIGGVGVGGGGDATGIVIGGIGAGSGGHLSGLSVGGIGVGAGGGVTGIAIGGIGVGSGGDLTGIAIGGVGVGTGGTLRGLGLGGVGVGAPRVVGAAIAGLMAGGEDVRWVVLAPGYFRIAPGGRFTGVAVSAYNHVGGSQHGLTVGLLNYAARLRGVQVGVLNYARNNRAPWKLVPIVNVHIE